MTLLAVLLLVTGIAGVTLQVVTGDTQREELGSNFDRPDSSSNISNCQYETGGVPNRSLLPRVDTDVNDKPPVDQEPVEQESTRDSTIVEDKAEHQPSSGPDLEASP